MKLAGKEFSSSYLRERIGNQAQLASVRRVILNDGIAKGTEAFDIETGSGLRFSVLPDRGMDISHCTFQGLNLVYLTPNGEVNPAFYDAQGLGWLQSFFGGLLTTCGLTTLGAPGKDGDEELGLHGRLSSIPARQVVDLSRWDGDEYRIEIRGTLEETRLFDNKLRMTRTISTTAGSRTLRIADVTENIGYEPSPFTVLYHINAGFPLLDQASRLVLTAERTEAHDPKSEKGIRDFSVFSAPIPGFAEENFLHLMGVGDDGMAHAAMLNPGLADGVGLALTFDTKQLPYMNEWKMMGQGDYVVGIEPCNAPCANRAVLRDAGLLPMLESGERRETGVEITVLTGEGELQAYAEAFERVPDFQSFTSL